MMLQNLSKLDKYDKQQLGSTQIQQPEILSGLTFYNFQNPEVTNTFNHVIGLPKKKGIEFPLFDCELLLFNTLTEQQTCMDQESDWFGSNRVHVCYIAWLCVKMGTNVYCH